MRLLAAGLLVAALLVLPNASAATASTVGLSTPTDPALSALANATTEPITVSIKLPTPFCQAEGTATVKLTVTATGAVTATLDKSSVTFKLPSNVGIPPTQPQDFDGQAQVNLTLTPNGPGAGTVNLVAKFDGNADGCSAPPDTSATPPDTSTTYAPAQKSINITTTSIGAAPSTTTSSTPASSTPASSTPASSTPSSSSPIGTTVGDVTPTDQAPTEEGKKGLPGPELGLVVAGVAAVAVLAARRK